MRISGCRPCTVFVVPLPLIQIAPQVHQDIPRTCIESGYRLVWSQTANIGYTANIDHSTNFISVGKRKLMKCGGQWRALAAKRDIATAEVRHRRDTSTRGNHIRVAYLPGKRWHGIGAMANGLTMAADGNYFFGPCIGCGQQ